MKQSEYDALSDALKSQAIKDHLGHIETEPAAAYFCNTRHGVEFSIRYDFRLSDNWQPLYLNPAHPMQEPVAWISPPLIAVDTSMYRADLEWRPLFTAR